VRGEEERDSALSVQRGEWIEQRGFGKVIRRVFEWRWKLLRRRLRLQLTLTFEGALTPC